MNSIPSTRLRVGRWFVLALMLGVVCAPVVSRAFQRIDRHRTPAQEYSRFRWANSCESVPKKITIAQAAEVASPVTATIVFDDRTPRDRHVAPSIHPCTSVVSSHAGLRAPPRLASQV